MSINSFYLDIFFFLDMWKYGVLVIFIKELLNLKLWNNERKVDEGIFIRGKINIIKFCCIILIFRWKFKKKLYGEGIRIKGWYKIKWFIEKLLRSKIFCW